jgi:AbrB family looped-hinge helix DNA binding protein
VGPTGQVVIPKELRDALGIAPGEELTSWRGGDQSPFDLRGRYTGRPLLETLEAERPADRHREGRR